MRIIKRVRELQNLADLERCRGQRLVLVPTMGALHEGHLELVRTARKHGDQVWLSIFVNPTQFGPNEDLEAYPRMLQRDLDRCRDEGVAVVFVPEAEEMYPADSQSWVEVDELSRPLCGRGRPGHFQGVTTIVSKLFLAAKPHVAVFGEKDYQQLAVIRRMVRDLHFDLEVVGVPIVREPDGLALSSRNQNLAPEVRQEALALVRALDAAEAAFAQGETRVAHLQELLEIELRKAIHGQLEYAEFRAADSLELLSGTLLEPAVLALALRLPAKQAGEWVRLIDNRVLAPQPATEEQS